MSYCRFSDGDVYMFNAGNGIICRGCLLTEETEHGYPNQIFETVWEAHDHLLAHRKAGHVVPDAAIHQLLKEVKQDMRKGLSVVR